MFTVVPFTVIKWHLKPCAAYRGITITSPATCQRLGGSPLAGELRDLALPVNCAHQIHSRPIVHHRSESSYQKRIRRARGKGSLWAPVCAEFPLSHQERASSSSSQWWILWLRCFSR
jgi:hypothetical protein